MKQRITIKDIARSLNIHHSTVSRALRNDPKVKEETRNRIREYARENGYMVNINALKLRGEVRNVIAVIVPNIHHFFFSNMVSFITNWAKKDGYIVSIFQSNESLSEEKEIIDTVIQNNAAGVIASISSETTECSHYDDLKKFDIPLVFFDRHCPTVEVPKVTVNNAAIVQKAVQHLSDNGYNNIAHLTGHKTLNVFYERSEGYKAGIQQCQKSYSRSVELEGEFNEELGQEIIKELLTEQEKPDALIIDSQNLAMGVILELRNSGVNIPEDIGLVVFGDNNAVNIIHPGITTITQPVEKIAQESYKLLSEQIQSRELNDDKRIELSCRLEVRGSSQRAC